MSRPIASVDFRGGPYQGTHAVAFNKAGGSDNWESENAVDIAAPVGTPVYAAQDGKIGSQFGPLDSSSPRMAGQRLHILAKGQEFYYAHLSAFAAGIKPGVSVKAGQIIGYSGEANGLAHLHFATKNASPNDYLEGHIPTNVTPVQPTQTQQAGPTPAATSAAAQQPLITPDYPTGPAIDPQVIDPPTIYTTSPDYSANSRKIQDAWREIANMPGASPDSIRMDTLVNGY